MQQTFARETCLLKRSRRCLVLNIAGSLDAEDNCGAHRNPDQLGDGFRHEHTPPIPPSENIANVYRPPDRASLKHSNRLPFRFAEGEDVRHTLAVIPRTNAPGEKRFGLDDRCMWAPYHVPRNLSVLGVPLKDCRRVAGAWFAKHQVP